MMAANRITGVAIVQEDGTLFTIISAKDIKVTITVIGKFTILRKWI